MAFTLLLGGARSGKSAMAQRLAERSRLPVTVIATAEARDEEMAERIRRHREDRPPLWRAIETPLDLLGAIERTPARDFLLVDCLTLWVSNLLEQGNDAEAIRAGAERVAIEMTAREGVVVTNEVGLGVVPANELARQFEDVLGWVNATFAESAARSILMVAGRAIDLTSAEALLNLP